MGLLDSFMEWTSDPRNAQALSSFGRALAQAGAPSRVGPTWGGGLSDAFAALNEGRQQYDTQQMEKRLRDMQVKKLQEEVRKASTINNTIDSALKGFGQPAPSQGASAQTQGSGMPSLYEMMALGKDDPKTAFDIFMKRKEGIERKPGSFYVNPESGVSSYQPDPVKGVDYRNGQVTMLPGADAVQSAISAAQTRATEQAKADVSQNTPQVFQGFGAGGAPVLATPNELRGMPNQQSPFGNGILPPHIQNVAEQLKANNIGFSVDSTGNIKIGGPLVGRSPSATGANPVTVAADKARAEAEAKLPTNSIELSNKTFMDNDYKGVVEKGQIANQAIAQAKVARTSLENLGGTTWATPARVAAAKVLNVVGIPQAEKIAANGELFKSTLYNHVLTKQLDQKGPQTESDAARIQQTYAQLSNTTKANNFLLDALEAQAELDKRRETFYRKALPIAQKEGNLSKVGEEWLVREPSIFDMPSMSKWKK